MNSVQRTQRGWSSRAVAVEGGEVRVWEAGAGPGVLVVGGALREAHDYFRLGEGLLSRHRVVVLERRGRPGSAPLTPTHELSIEVDDLVAVQQSTGARLVFGHSFGGLVALEALARHPARFDGAVLYEPGVSVNGAISTSWLPRYRALLSAGARRRAFAWFIQSSGQAPAFTAALPFWYLTLVLAVVLRGAPWRSMNRLLEANAREHELVGAHGELPLTRLSTITAPLLLVGGERSPRWMTHLPFEALTAVVPHAHSTHIPKAGHLAPTDEAPDAIARQCLAFFSSDGSGLASGAAPPS